MTHRYVVAMLSLVFACKGEPAAPAVVDPGPMRVTIASASGNYVPDNYDDVTLLLRNSGGAGTYRLTFVGHAITPNGPLQIQQGDPVTVLEGYEESVTWRVHGMSEVQAVRVESRPINSSVYTRTDCELLRGALAFYCQ